MIDLTRASYVGPPLDPALALGLPSELRDLLVTANGFILFDGGLHVRGLCDLPRWHSLERYWTGEDALSKLYPAIHPEDLPFAQDFLGDQFLLRDSLVIKLSAETGEVQQIGIGLKQFLTSASKDPDGFLSLNLLRQFLQSGVVLEPGQLLNVYPPLCIRESANGVNLRPIPALELIRYLADFAHQIGSLPDGASIRMMSSKSK